MTYGLKSLADEVKNLTGREQVFIVPPPYKKGHFAVQGDAKLPEGCGFTASFAGDTTFIKASPEKLLNALRDMAGEEKIWIEPSLSPVHTLIYQILCHFGDGCAADEPELLRLALDLEEESPRTKTVYDAICRLLHEKYADALREDRKKSCLPLIAARMIETNFLK